MVGFSRGDGRKRDAWGPATFRFWDLLGVRPHVRIVASMNSKSIIVAVLLAFAAFVLLSLVCGAPYLGIPLPGGLPLGNVLTALGLCAMSGASVVMSPRGGSRRPAALLALAASVLWLPISVLLAGNLQLNFGSGRGVAWIAFSVAVLAGACFTLLWALGASVLSKFCSAGAA